MSSIEKLYKLPGVFVNLNEADTKKVLSNKELTIRIIENISPSLLPNAHSYQNIFFVFNDEELLDYYFSNFSLDCDNFEKEFFINSFSRETVIKRIIDFKLKHHV